jgi:hypothetical protein
LAVTPLSDALPGNSDAIFSQTASLTTNRSPSTPVTTPPKRRLNHSQAVTATP